jgi:hypothetical protein
VAFSWFRRRRPIGEAPRLKPRRERRPGPRPDLAEVAPELRPFLAQAACLQLGAFQALSALVADVPGFSAKEAVGLAAGRSLARHQRLVAELMELGEDPEQAMTPFGPAVEAYFRRVRGEDWVERLLAARIGGGLLDDFFAVIAPGVDAGGRRGLPALFEVDPHDGGALEAILLERLAADPALGSRLAMWGRRLVGDTLLVARSVLALSGDPDTDEAHMEPIFTEIIAAHTRRMDALGLTA